MRLPKLLRMEDVSSARSGVRNWTQGEGKQVHAYSLIVINGRQGASLGNGKHRSRPHRRQ